MNGLFSLFLCVVACGLVAQAEETPPIHDESVEIPEDVQLVLPEFETMGGLFLKVDTDKDGKMSMPELIAFWKVTRRHMLMQHSEEDMKLFDRDYDHQISLEEFIQKEEEDFIKEDVEDARKKSFEELETAKFKAADKNGDGVLDEHELPDAVYGETHEEIGRIMAAHHLKVKDTNGDGELDAKEFIELVEMKDSKTEESHKEAEWEFKKQDADGNGKLNLEELVHWESGAFHMTVDLEHLFAVADANKDSHITLAELSEHLKELEGSNIHEHLHEWLEHHPEL